MSAEAAPARQRGALEWCVVALLAAAVTLPFLDKAFHIDDVFFHHVTLNILADPLDPYAGEIDWWHQPGSLFRGDSNPPLLNYYLAPFAAGRANPEFALHAAMAPFALLFAAALLVLGRRFTSNPLLVTAFAMTSAGVVVSGNVMRDVPAAALGTAAVAAVVLGTDRDRARLLLLGSLLAGFGVLTKYSGLVLLPVIYAYPLLKRRPRFALFALVPLAMFGAWCLHGQLVYGEPHLVAQLGRGFNRPGHGWADNAFGLPVVAGSLLYLFPALLLRGVTRRDGALLAGTAAATAALAWATVGYMAGGQDGQLLFWALSGGALILVCAFEGIRGARPLLRDTADARASDSLFLTLWLLLPLVFSTLSVPFQAVRHLLPALAPLVLLAFRYLAPPAARLDTAARVVLGVLLVAQAGVAFAVARVDADYADSYRDFAATARNHLPAGRDDVADTTIWFVGHWGWLYYAEQAGFKQLHVRGPQPEPGDLLIEPAYVDKGSVLARLPKLTARLHKLEQVVYSESIPIRTLHPAGAHFYALFTKQARVPYRFQSEAPLEIFEIYEVR
jgi:hypothetical protein